MLCIKEKCTGCCACISVCPKNAIRMKEDDYGFKYPVIDKSLCISCGLCSKTCEKIQSIEKQQIKESYIFQSKNKELLLNSSSGGIFGELAQYFLSANGIVIGATMKNNGTEFVTKHIFIDNKNNLNLLQGSKYCQSDICDSYLQVKKHLEDGKKVLFSGTPCQVAGLKSFLKKDFNNLLTVDISCEGVPSQKFFNDYVKYLEKYITKDPIVDIKFRDKKDFNWYNQGLVILSKKHNLLKKTTIPKSQSSYFSLKILTS